MLRLEDLETYKLSMNLGEKIWNMVVNWNYFEKDTVGKQLVRAVDSIAANISEAYGRYHYKENKQFCYYARGSLLETKTWLEKAKNRELLFNNNYKIICLDLETIHKKLNAYIRSIGKTKNPIINDQ